MPLEGKRSVLTIYVIWHPAFEGGSILAGQTFRWLQGDPFRPAVRGLGIPVRYRTSEHGSRFPPEIDFDSSDHSVAIVLIDDEMVAAHWDEYILGLLRGAREGKDLVLPVALTGNALELCPQITSVNMLRLDKLSAELLNDSYLTRVTHDLCRLLSHDGVKVQVFISHSKEDGLTIARDVQAYLHRETAVSDFFDANDIPDGTRFADVINEAVAAASVLLVVHTDSYSSREWCRLEVLEAKRRHIPIVLFSAVEEGELRSFPYLGNIPVIRWRGNIELSAPPLLGTLLREVLIGRYFPLRVEAIRKLHGGFEGRAYLHPPELLTALMLRVQTSDGVLGSRVYLYPDPPLGAEELELLKDLDPTLDPVTPTILMSR